MLSWCRARLSNQLAHTGKNWAQVYSLYHSGTYVNQWMVLDFHKFIPGNDPTSGFLTVLEEVPGFIHFEDMTSHLVNTSYWASFNNPYFEDISRLTGQWELCQTVDPTDCYETDPRNMLFKANQDKIQHISDLQWLISMNHFQYDPISMNDSCYVSLSAL